MHMPLKWAFPFYPTDKIFRDAFYCFVQICVRYLPKYYSAGLEAVQVDGDILVTLLKEKAKPTYIHLVCLSSLYSMG